MAKPQGLPAAAPSPDASPHPLPTPSTQTVLNSLDASVDATAALYERASRGDDGPALAQGLLHVAGILVALAGDQAPEHERGRLLTIGKAITRSAEGMERAA